MEAEPKNINVIRSVWRRMKKDLKVRDLHPKKDAKGGSLKYQAPSLQGSTLQGSTLQSSSIQKTVQGGGGPSVA